MQFTIERDKLAPALKLLAGITERRNTVPVLACVRIVAHETTVTLCATDLDTMARVTIPADVSEQGDINVGAAELSRLATKASKGGAMSFADTDDGQRVAIVADGARFRLAAVPGELPDMTGFHDADGYEAIDLSDARALACPVEGYAVADKAAKLFAKVTKLYPDHAADIETGRGQGEAVQVQALCGPWEIYAKCGMPEFKRAKRDPFSYQLSSDGYKAAGTYLRDLATARGFDLDALAVVPAYGDDKTPRTPEQLAIIDGEVMGATYGDVLQHAVHPGAYIRRDPTPAEIAERRAELESMYPDGHPFADDYFLRQVDARTTVYVPAVYADGAFSIVMPRESRAMAALVTLAIMNDDGVWSDPKPVRVNDRGSLDWDSLPAVADLFAAPPVMAEFAGDGLHAVEPVECPPAPPATIEAETLESPCAPAGAEMAAISAPVAIPAPVAPPATDLGATVSALLDRVAALESDAVQRRAMVAAIAGAPARDNAARLRGARAYLELRAHRTVCRNLQRQLDAGQVQYDAIKAERDALAAERELLCQERDATIMRATHAERTLHNMGERLQGATRRADRMARAAVTQRKVASRATGDLAAARAESRALTRRLDDARALRAVADARPLPPPPTDTAMAHAFAAAA